MSKRVYISADYSENDGDRDVINELHTWGERPISFENWWIIALGRRRPYMVRIHALN